MKVLHGLDGLRQLPPGAVVSIGNYDGVHRGHARILEVARSLRSQGAQIAVVTFEPHPLTVLRPGSAPPRLTPPHLKQNLLAEHGVDTLVVLPPAPEVLDLTAEQFWHALRDQVRPSHLVEGPSFSFGKDRQGNIERLREWTASAEVQLHVIDPVEAVLLDLSIVPVSSSIIRWLLGNGRIRDAAICFGRPYVLEGEVIKGHGRGRKLGIPTANLRCADQVIPLDGVYAGRCVLDGSSIAAAISIGTMPTFGQHERQIEAHLVDFDGDLYGRRLELQFTDWLRDQLKFHTLGDLKRQLRRDIEQTRLRAADDPARPIAPLC